MRKDKYYSYSVVVSQCYFFVDILHNFCLQCSNSANNVSLQSTRHLLSSNICWHILDGHCIFWMATAYFGWPLHILNGHCIFWMATAYFEWPLHILDGHCVFWMATAYFGWPCKVFICLICVCGYGVIFGGCLPSWSTPTSSYTAFLKKGMCKWNAQIIPRQCILLTS